MHVHVHVLHVYVNEDYNHSIVIYNMAYKILRWIQSPGHNTKSYIVNQLSCKQIANENK